ncbi:MAG: hypothetical protein JWM82_3555 [Myxococcales bacterium]|nr:hypothetical protein [Myxococcales bacterium]
MTLTKKTRLTMTDTNTDIIVALCLGLLLAGCGPTFEPASLVETTRVLGARVEVEGAPDRATPKPGETASVTWLVTSPDAAPPLHWAFAVCAPGNVSLSCDGPALARFEGTEPTPRLSLVVPPQDALGAARRLVIYGEICPGVDSLPIFDPQDPLPRCTDGGGTPVSTSVSLQLNDDANHNPTAARDFTFDGQAWPALAAGDEPCITGPRVQAGSQGHAIGDTLAGSDREPYTALVGTPPIAVPTRESLQISQLTTAGKLKSQFSFVEATDVDATTTVDVSWDAPPATEVSDAGLAVTFTFVTRDNRGGTAWITRAVCVDR